MEFDFNHKVIHSKSYMKDKYMKKIQRGGFVEECSLFYTCIYTW